MLLLLSYLMPLLSERGIVNYVIASDVTVNILHAFIHDSTRTRVLITLICAIIRMIRVSAGGIAAAYCTILLACAVALTILFRVNGLPPAA